MAKFLLQVLGIAYLESRFIKRQPTWILQGFLSAIGFTMLLYVWGSIEALKNLVIAYIITGAWGLGLNIVAQSIGWDKIYKGFEYRVASPVTLPIYFAGMVLGSSPFLITDIVPALVVALIFKMNLLLLLTLIPLAGLALILGAFLSLSIVLRIEERTNISAITNPLYTLTITLPPVYYPLYVLPEPIRSLTLLLPSVSLMELARWITGYAKTSYHPLIPSLVLAVWTIITTILVVRKFKWGLR